MKQIFINKLLKKSFSVLRSHSCGSSPAFGGMDSRFRGSDGLLEFYRNLLTWRSAHEDHTLLGS